jgi:hypothetical protein
MLKLKCKVVCSDESGPRYQLRWRIPDCEPPRRDPGELQRRLVSSNRTIKEITRFIVLRFNHLTRGHIRLSLMVLSRSH